MNGVRLLFQTCIIGRFKMNRLIKRKKKKKKITRCYRDILGSTRFPQGLKKSCQDRKIDISITMPEKFWSSLSLCMGELEKLLFFFCFLDSTWGVRGITMDDRPEKRIVG